MQGCSLIEIKKVVESDGVLLVMENDKEIPFSIERIFLVTDVLEGKTRGDHATKKTRLILFPVSGSCKVVVDNGFEKETHLMDDKSKGLLIEPMIWRSMQEFSSDCTMMAVCDRKYAPGEETIDDYEEYLDLVKGKQ